MSVQEQANPLAAERLEVIDRLTEQIVERDRVLVEFDAWLSFRGEFSEVLTAFREAFGTDTSAEASS